MSRNVLEDAYNYVIELIQNYGWYIVGTILLLYFNWHRIVAFQKARSLAAANDPQRKAALDAERLRIRLKQQKSLDHTD